MEDLEKAGYKGLGFRLPAVERYIQELERPGREPSAITQHLVEKLYEKSEPPKASGARTRDDRGLDLVAHVLLLCWTHLACIHHWPQLPAAARAYIEGPGARGFEPVDAGAAYVPPPSAGQYSDVQPRISNKLDRSSLQRGMAALHTSITKGAYMRAWHADSDMHTHLLPLA